MGDNTNTFWQRVRPRRSKIICGLGALPLLIATGANAEPTNEKSSGGYSYIFESEFLDGDSLTGDGPLLKVRTGSGYIPLIRPRTSYVRELVKSVENL